jgi:hypothetical protein
MNHFLLDLYYVNNLVEEYKVSKHSVPKYLLLALQRSLTNCPEAASMAHSASSADELAANVEFHCPVSDRNCCLPAT